MNTNEYLTLAEFFNIPIIIDTEINYAYFNPKTNPNPNNLTFFRPDINYNQIIPLIKQLLQTYPQYKKRFNLQMKQKTLLKKLIQTINEINQIQNLINQTIDDM